MKMNKHDNNKATDRGLPGLDAAYLDIVHLEKADLGSAFPEAVAPSEEWMAKLAGELEELCPFDEAVASSDAHKEPEDWPDFEGDAEYSELDAMLRAMQPVTVSREYLRRCLALDPDGRDDGDDGTDGDEPGGGGVTTVRDIMAALTEDSPNHRVSGYDKFSFWSHALWNVAAVLVGVLSVSAAVMHSHQSQKSSVESQTAGAYVREHITGQ